MQLSALPVVAVTPKATTKTVTPYWSLSSRVYLQGSPEQVSSPSVRMSRNFWRHWNEVSCAPAMAAQPPSVPQVSAEQPLYQVRKFWTEAPSGVEPPATSGRWSSFLSRRNVSEPERSFARKDEMRKSGTVVLST